MSKKKSNFNSFQDMAKFLEPEKATAIDDSLKKPDCGLISDLKKLYVSTDDYSGFRSHMFGNAPPINDQLVLKARKLGDAFFESHIGERWPDEHTDKLGDFNEECSDIIQTIFPLLSFKSRFPGLFVFSACEKSYPLLPKGYSFKGGVARKALALSMGINIYTYPVRDMDILFFGDQRNLDLEDVLAKSFMQDDWLFAKKSVVEMVPNIKAYLKTREFSVNEVVLNGTEIICSIQCLMDMIGGVIRLTHNYLRRSNSGIGGIIAMKAVRFFSEGIAEGRSMVLPELPIDQKKILPFHVALHLSRALERSRETAEIFLNKSCSLGLIPAISLSGIVENDLVTLEKKSNNKRP